MCSPGLLVLDVLKSLFEQTPNMWIVQAMEHVPPFPTEGD